MMWPLRLVLVALLATVGVTRPALSQTAPPLSPSPFGVNGTQRGLGSVYDEIFSEDGTAWVRVFLPWPAIQPTPAPPQWDRRAMGPPCHGWPKESAREIIDNAHAAGFSILAVVTGTPCWAVAGGAMGSCGSKAARDPLFENFMTAIVQEFGDKVAAWELGNEPNWNSHWSGTPELYRDKILKPGYDGVKRARADALVAGPALWREGLLPGDKTDRFAPYLLDADDTLARPIDILTFHSYQQNPKRMKKDIRAAHAFAVGNDIPEVWMTEYGWTKSGGGPDRSCGRCRSERDCLRKLEAVIKLSNPVKLPRFTRSFVFSLHDRNRGFCVKGCRFGIFDVNGAARARLQLSEPRQ